MAVKAASYRALTSTPVDLDISGLTVVDADVSDKEINEFILTYNYPAFYRFDPKATSGDGYYSVTVQLGVFYRLKGLTALWTPLLVPASGEGTMSSYIYTIADKALTTNSREQRSGALPLGVYEILVVRYTESNASNHNIVDTVYVASVTGIRYAALTYNNTALLGVKIRATDQINGSIPTITSLVQGTKIALPNLPIVRHVITNKVVTTSSISSASAGYHNSTPDTYEQTCEYYIPDYSVTWDGTLTYEENPDGVPYAGKSTKYYSVNPVWCLYDLLTNDRYGLKDYYKISPDKLGIMKANFFIMGKYCDEIISYVDNLGNTQSRPRFMLNLVIDQSKSASEWVATIAGIMRASLFYAEGIYWIDIDRPKNMSQIFNMSSIKEYMQSSTSIKSIPNVYDVQWINPAKDYEIDVFRLESKEFQQNPDIEERKKALSLIGVTNFDQARSLAKYALLTGQLRNRTITFKTGTQGLRTMVGSVIGIQHDVPQWGWGGKISGVQPNRIEINPPIEYRTSQGAIKLVISRPNSAPVWTDVTVDNEGTVSFLNLSNSYTYERGGAVSFTPRVGDSFIGYLNSHNVHPYIVTNIKRDSNDVIEIQGVNYVESIYAACDNNSDLGVTDVYNYYDTRTISRSSVKSVVPQFRNNQDNGGNWYPSVVIAFDPPADNFWVSAELYYKEHGATEYSIIRTPSSRGIFTIDTLRYNTTYDFVIISVYKEGRQTVSDALGDSTSKPYGTITTPSDISGEQFSSGVVGLAITGSADNTFTGRDCVISWRVPLVVNSLGTAGSDSFGAGTTKNNNIFSHYEVEIRNTNGSIRRKAMVTEPKYVYTHEMNHEDIITRTFTVTVVAYDKLGRASTPVTMTCTNPAPAVLA